MAGLKKSLEAFPIEISAHTTDDSNLVCFLSQEMDSGGWPGSTNVNVDQDAPDFDPAGPLETEIEFDPVTLICPFMEEDQILVMMQSGAEKLRYISGDAQAYNAKGDAVYLDLTSIYQLAANAFGVSLQSITLAEY